MSKTPAYFLRATRLVAERKREEAEEALDGLLRVQAEAKRSGARLPSGFWQAAFKAQQQYRIAVKIVEGLADGE